MALRCHSVTMGPVALKCHRYLWRQSPLVHSLAQLAVTVQCMCIQSSRWLMVMSGVCIQTADVVCATCAGAGDPRLAHFRFRKARLLSS